MRGFFEEFINKFSNKNRNLNLNLNILFQNQIIKLHLK